MNDKDAAKNAAAAAAAAASLDATKTDKRKQSLYFPESMLQEIKEEAARLDRSLSTQRERREWRRGRRRRVKARPPTLPDACRRPGGRRVADRSPSSHPSP
jgi:uncharacterized small protein (TIGR04563 family)